MHGPQTIRVNILLSLQRDCSIKLAQETINLIKKYRDQGVVGLDISGDSTKGDCSAIFSILSELQTHDIPITLHIGESKEEGPGQQMIELKAIKPKRVGHCVHLCQEAQKWIRDNKVPVELCLSSAYYTGMITTGMEHPAFELIKEYHPVVICTDDPLIFNTRLPDEIALVGDLLGLPVSDIAYMQLETIEKNYIFESDQKKIEQLKIAMIPNINMTGDFGAQANRQ